ncbi:MAG TPA: HPr family phosphocarrier protein [Alphaproteobacteria bacterium]|nr:HPr family phosphocarrier protein [Rhodospirillaceae bacterium]HRJ12353.1 HPr family phosphocarrier protein [Alphaproteobacteria bacterium]
MGNAAVNITCHDTWVVVHATITNVRGLHARAAAKFVKMASQYESQIVVEKEKGDMQVDGTSIMDLMMLVASQGTKISISASGVDAETAANNLRQLVERRFDETE